MSYPRIYNAAADMVDRHVARGRAAKAAFIDPGETLSYGELAARSNRMANLLATYGIAREQRVALLLLDTVDFPVAFWGAIKAGVVPVCLNTLLTAEQYAYILGDSRAKALFVSAPLLPVVQPILGQLPFLKHVFVAGGEPAAFALSFRGELGFQQAGPSWPTPAATRPRSGSTRRAPPACPRACATCIRARWRRRGSPARAASACARTTSSTRRPSCSSPTASATPCPFRCRWAPPPCCGRSGPTPELVFRTLKQHQPTFFFGVPTLYAAMLAYPQGTPENSSRAPAHLRLRRRGAAGRGRQGVPRQVRRRCARRRRLHRDAAPVRVQQPGR